MPAPDRPVDFFVSHADADLEWAEWIAAELEGAGYGVILKAWDFRPGENILARHDEALATCRHAICVLSENYVDSEVAARTAAQYQDLTGKERALIPVKVAGCDPPPTLAPTIAIDLSGTGDPNEARRLLLAGVGGQAERVARRGFPGGRAKVRFPGTPAEVWDLRGHRADPFFTGRDEELADLHRALRAGRPTSAVQVITGLGGQGKTALTVEYAFRHAGAYDVAWWIRAEDPATLRGDYVELAAELGLPAEKDDQAIAALKRELRRRRDWLLIFDNAEDSEDLFQLLPERHAGHVLITSRLREWTHAETRHLDVLPASAAAAYLQRRGRAAADGAVAEIADTLGCLPLALVQAASAVARMGAANYLDLLRQQESRLLAAGSPAGRERTVASTWRVSIDRLAQQSPRAVALFRLCAFLAADAIPLTHLPATAGLPPELAAALADPIELDRTTEALGEYSLAEAVGGLLSIHRLVQAVTRAELGDDASRWAGVAVAVIAAAFPDDENDPACWERCEEVLAHALTCTAHASALHVDAIATMELLNRVAGYLLTRGRLGSADVVLDQAFKAAVDLNREDPVYLSCRSTYGQLMFRRGDTEAAQTIHEGVYQARIRVLGAEHPDTLRAGRDYVEALYKQGHEAEAAALHEGITDSFRTVLGADHLETITATAYRATILRYAGQYSQARALEEHVVEARTEMLGDDHPATLYARSSLATTIWSMGELRKAQAIEEQVLKAWIRVLGKEHPNTLSAKENLSVTLTGLGELARARAMMEQVAEARVRILGEEHPDTLSSKMSLARDLSNAGNPVKAKEIAEQVLETGIRVLGEEHPETTEFRSDLAAILYGLGDFTQARAIEEHVLEVHSRIRGADHPRTLTATENLALTLLRLEESDRARTLLEEVLDARTRMLGKDSPGTFDTMANLAMALRELGELDKARAIEEAVLDAQLKMLGEDNLPVLMAKANLALTLLAQGDDDRAMPLLTESLNTAIRVFGVKHTATTEAAWRLVENCGPHEAARRQMLIVRYLAWMSRAKSGQLTASQKKIREGLGASRPAGSQGNQKRR